MITQKELKSFAAYDPKTGVFTRTHSPCNSVKVGQELGWQKSCGSGLKYRETEYDGRGYQLHQLAYLYMTGELPEGDIDHIDGNGLNNSWSNLRVVTKAQNQQNRRKNENNKSGTTGVSFFKQTNKWRAAININGKKKHLGYFDTLDKAVAARAEAQAAAGYHENHGKDRKL